MVQVLESNEHSFLDSILGGAAGGARAATQLMPYLQQQQQMQQEKEAMSKKGQEFGLNLNGLNPTVQKQMLADQFKHNLKIEQQKADEDFVNKIINRKKQPPTFSDQLHNGQQPNEMDQSNGQEQNQTPELSEEDMLHLAARKPALANTLLKEQSRKSNVDLAKQRLAFSKKEANYKHNEKYIDSTSAAGNQAEKKLADLEVMDQLSDETSDSFIMSTLELLGLQPEWLNNPANEQYSKLSLDLLGGGTLQSDYGSKVLQSEFHVSQQRIPTLKQSKEGRRQISENMKFTLLPSKLKADRLQHYMKEYNKTGKLPNNLEAQIKEDIKPELDKAYDDFKNRNGRYKVSKGTKPDDNAIEKYAIMSKYNEDKAIALMKEDGYDVD